MDDLGADRRGLECKVLKQLLDDLSRLFFISFEKEIAQSRFCGLQESVSELFCFGSYNHRS
ncbi:hypothetical protein KAJ77_12460 [bacterium]|nr:hypothetical protein [bacterium]